MAEIRVLGADLEDAQAHLDSTLISLREACTTLLTTGTATLDELSDATGLGRSELLSMLGTSEPALP